MLSCSKNLRTAYSSTRAPKRSRSPAESSRPPRLGRDVEREIEIPRAACARLGGEIDTERADDDIARLDFGHVEVGDLAADGDAVPRGPFDGPGVAGDEEGGQGFTLTRSSVLPAT